MKSKTARKILCSEKTAKEVASTRGEPVEKVRREAKSLLNRLNKRERQRKKGV